MKKKYRKLLGTGAFAAMLMWGLIASPSMVVAATPKPTAPQITSAVANDSGVQLRFTKSQNASGYEVRLGNAQRSTVLAQLAANRTEWSTNQMPAGDKFWMFIRAVGPGGYADSNVVMLTAPLRYAKPIATFPETGGYLGFGTQVGSARHNGADYASTVGASVYAVTDGVVVYSGTNFAGFGSLNPSAPGGAMVVEHVNRQGQRFFSIYGHMTPMMKAGVRVTKGQQIGTIHQFTNGGQKLPHLHLGIYIGPQFPTSGWGYSTSLANWADPKSYLESNL